MRLRILAVGSRMPAWVDTAMADYLRRIRSPWKLELIEIEAAPRSATRGAAQAVAREGERVLAARILPAPHGEHGDGHRFQLVGRLESAHRLDRRGMVGNSVGLGYSEFSLYK